VVKKRGFIFDLIFGLKIHIAKLIFDGIQEGGRTAVKTHRKNDGE